MLLPTAKDATQNGNSWREQNAVMQPSSEKEKASPKTNRKITYMEGRGDQRSGWIIFMIFIKRLHVKKTHRTAIRGDNYIE